jgi:hypothetical protein
MDLGIQGLRIGPGFVAELPGFGLASVETSRRRQYLRYLGILSINHGFENWGVGNWARLRFTTPRQVLKAAAGEVNPPEAGKLRCKGIFLMRGFEWGVERQFKN